MLVDEGQQFIFGQFLWVDPGLGVVNYNAVHPGPEETLRMANAEKEEKKASFS